MKRVLAILFSVMMFVCIPTAAIAVSAETSGEYTYTVLKDGTIEITRYSGSQAQITIPSAMAGRRVTSLGANAFSNNSALKKVVIPENVTNIGYGAFMGNERLTSITLPSTLTVIPDCMLSGCTALKQITLPTSLTTIGWWAFSGCTALESISFPKSLKEIQWYAFEECSSLKSVTIPEGVETISLASFRLCKTLKSVSLPDSVTVIDDSAFAFCENLTDIVIPSSVKTIGYAAFEECGKLTKIAIPHGVTTIEDRTFLGCGSLESIAIPETVRSIGEYAVTSGRIKAIYYAGTQEQWDAIEIHKNGNQLTQDEVLYEARVVSIVEQPVSVSVPNGQTATVTVQAVGDGLIYQWYFKNKGTTTFSYTSTFKSNTYSVEMNHDRAGRTVYCVVKDQYGFEVSSRAVTVDNVFAITQQPANVAVPVGALAKTTVKVSGDGLTYQWYVRDVGQSSYTKSSIKSSTYSFTMTEAKSGRSVYCVITDKSGKQKQSNTVSMNMIYPPRITQQPTDITVDIGQRAQTYVTATGDGLVFPDGLTYQWYFKNKGMGSFAKSSVGGNVYECEMTSDKHERQIYCLITDAYGQKVKSQVVTLRVTKPTITKQPTNAAAKIGETVQTSVQAKGVDLTYQWYYKNPGTKSFYKSSVKSAVYSYTMTNAKAGRQVYCVMTDKYGRQVKSNTVTLCVPAPVITKQPSSAFTNIGQMVKTSIKAEGDGLKYQWYCADPDPKNPEEWNFKKSAVTSSLYSYSMTEAKNNRRVYCVVTDEYGQQVKSETVTLGIVRPAITQQPVDSNTAVGKMAKATVKATGINLKYEWYILEPGAESFIKSKVTSSTYSFEMTAKKAGRRAYCVITDKYGQSVQTNLITFS